MKILISTSSFGKFDRTPLDLLEKAQISYTLNPYARTLTEQEAKELYSDCVAVIAGTEPVTHHVIEANETLKVISRCGVGMDNVDSICAKQKNIAVLCTPNAPTQATAEQTLTLILNLLRHTALMYGDMRQGFWKKRMGNLLYKKKVGIIGYGRIGSTVAKLLKAFECEIACYDPYLKNSDIPQYELKELLSWANIITLHCAKEKNAPPLIDEKALNTMRQGSWIINAARGGLIDEFALTKALKSGHLAGAALDVFQEEPYIGELLTLENALLTPHASSYAKEARINMEIQAVENLLNELGIK